jgi:hypothetical protein
MRDTVFFILMMFALSGWSQDTIPLSNEFPFKDGIYLSFEEFKSNHPTHGFDEFEIDHIDSTDYDLTKVKNVKVVNKKGKMKNVSMGNIWGLCYQGVPYIFYRGTGKINTPFSTYNKLTRIDVIGTISMFRLELLSKPYNTGTFVNSTGNEKEDIFVLDMLLDMHSGKTYPFSFNAVKHHIKEDTMLANELEIHKHEINLYDIVFAYNLRNPIYPAAVSYFENNETD